MQGLIRRRVPPGHPGAGIMVRQLHYSADPVRWSPAMIASLKATYTSEARWRREMECEAEALEGELLYPQFHVSRNVCPPANLSDPNYWTLWMALDPHPRTAHAMVYEAFNKYGDCIVCGEFWPEFGTKYGPTDGARYLTRDYAEAIQLFESDSKNKPVPFEWARGRVLKVAGRRFMDTFGKATYSDEGGGEDYFESYLRLGNEMKVNLMFRPALKGSDNLRKAEDSIGRKLMPSQGGGPPRMKVFETCTETIEEFENVRFPEGEAETARDEKVVTYQKHCLDCIAEDCLVMTDHGEVPIQFIQTGDMVLTRDGWKGVQKAWYVGVRPVLKARLSNGGIMVATAEHRVMANGDWKSYGNLTKHDKLEACLTRYVSTAKRIIGGEIMRKGSVPSAAESLSAIAITGQALARSVVSLRSGPEPCGMARVYDLSVEGAHEFYASGVLVHNCLHYIETGRPGFIELHTRPRERVPICEATGW